MWPHQLHRGIFKGSSVKSFLEHRLQTLQFLNLRLLFWQASQTSSVPGLGEADVEAGVVLFTWVGDATGPRSFSVGSNSSDPKTHKKPS
ncbi:hypothetical protein ACLOJK_003976 [Asimina triloba]